MLAPRAHVFQHVRVVPAYTGTFLNLHTEGVLNVDTPSLPPSFNTPHTHSKKKIKKNEGEQEEVIVSSAYQYSPTKGYHVLQRFTEENHWMTIQHECSHIFLLITTHETQTHNLGHGSLSYESMLTC